MLLNYVCWSKIIDSDLIVCRFDQIKFELTYKVWVFEHVRKWNFGLIPTPHTMPKKILKKNSSFVSACDAHTR